MSDTKTSLIVIHDISCLTYQPHDINLHCWVRLILSLLDSRAGFLRPNLTTVVVSTEQLSRLIQRSLSDEDCQAGISIYRLTDTRQNHKFQNFISIRTGTPLNYCKQKKDLIINENYLIWKKYVKIILFNLYFSANITSFQIFCLTYICMHWERYVPRKLT